MCRASSHCALLGVPYLAAKWDSRCCAETPPRVCVDSAADVVYVDHLGMARYLPDITGRAAIARVVLEQHNVESDLYEQLAESVQRTAPAMSRAEWASGGALRDARARRPSMRWSPSPTQTPTTSTRVAGVCAHVVPVVRRGRAPDSSASRAGRISATSAACVGVPTSLGSTGSARGVAEDPRPRPGCDDGDCRSGPRSDSQRQARGSRRLARCLASRRWASSRISSRCTTPIARRARARSRRLGCPHQGSRGPPRRTADRHDVRRRRPGLSLTDGKEALIASDPDAFAERVGRLVRDAELRTRLRDEGYTYLEKHHSPAVAQRALRTALGIGPVS